MKERYNDGQCVVEGLAGEELRQIVATPDTGEAGDTSQVTTQHCPPSSKRLHQDIRQAAAILTLFPAPGPPQGRVQDPALRAPERAGAARLQVTVVTMYCVMCGVVVCRVLTIV